jgi:transcription antitermination protein NusB
VSPTGRRTARRQAVFILYQQDLLGLSPQAAIARENEGDVDGYTRRLVLGVAGKKEELDAQLVPHLAHWSLERLGALERSILRLAAYELLHASDVPPAVAIDEAVTLAKRFCSDEAGALINGVLGSLVGPADDSRDTKIDDSSKEE